MSVSYCKDYGKDRVIMLTKEDYEKPLAENFPALSVSLDDDDFAQGPILPNGEINWGCPCMGGMVAGPCGYEFRQAFSCFHYSKEDPKGSECMKQFADMHTCITKYPSLYGNWSKEKSNGDLSENAGSIDEQNAVTAKLLDSVDNAKSADAE
ncbi:unnamed protein product [Soboliphyme baturini]|uniref:CHCH domain-containing protein n=1 Tax=Soboliphyme baturini TaxID=241478 RepID=A0A183I903_9BILA|nr:unnamed protein product [Soboliphyme baturini]